MRFMTCVIGLTWAISGCSQPVGPVAPSSTVTPPSPSPSPRAMPEVTGVLPSVGSSGGGATTAIVGTGFMPGMVVTFDGTKVIGRFDSRDLSVTTFYTEAPEHAPGPVDVVVTNPDGQSNRLAAGYTYAPQESFDVNGVWTGYTLNGSDTAVDFVIQDSRLLSASCAYEFSVRFTLSTSPAVHGGEFSVTEDGGATISGRILSASEMAGTISVPSCTTMPLPWRASRTSR